MMRSHTLAARRSPWASLAHTLACALALLLFPLAPQARAEDPVKIRAVPQYPEVEQGAKLVIAVEMAHIPKHHSWPAAEVKLPASVADFAIRTEIGPPIDDDKTEAAQKAARDAKKPDAEVDAIHVYKLPSWLRLDGVQYPEVHTEKVADPGGGTTKLDVPVYLGKAIAYIRYVVAPDAPLGDQSVQVRVYSQTCDEQTCFPPDEKLITVKLKVVAKGASTPSASTDKALFEKFDDKKWGPTPAPATNPTAPPTKPADSPKPAPPTKHSSAPAVPTPAAPAVAAGPMGASFFGFNIGASAIVLALFGALGGILLNL
ncbi:MAG TPA: hypothetical protein VG940_10690, partial [Gemmatimonadales bacterium]|nr:hypothetical protein [Gemmatimonadales bacterium]